MVAPNWMSQAEITSTQVKITDDGRNGSVDCFTSDGSPLILTMTRPVLERFSYQAKRELNRVPAPVRSHSPETAESRRLPIVTYYFRGLSQETMRREMGCGYAVERDGQLWCVPTEEQTDVSPTASFQLDRSQLLEFSNTGGDRRLYQYLREVELAQPNNQTPPQPIFGGQTQVGQPRRK